MATAHQQAMQQREIHQNALKGLLEGKELLKPVPKTPKATPGDDVKEPEVLESEQSKAKSPPSKARSRKSLTNNTKKEIVTSQQRMMQQREVHQNALKGLLDGKQLLKPVPKSPTPPPISQEIKENDSSELAIQNGHDNDIKPMVLKTVQSKARSPPQKTRSRKALTNNIKKEKITSHEKMMQQRDVHQNALKGLLDCKQLLKPVPKSPSPPPILQEVQETDPTDCLQCSELAIQNGHDNDIQSMGLNNVQSKTKSPPPKTKSLKVTNNTKKEKMTSHENIMQQRDVHQNALKGLLDGKQLLKPVPKSPSPPPISQDVREIDPTEYQTEVLKTVKSNLPSARSATGSRNALINNIKKEMMTSEENFMQQRKIHQETLKGLLGGKQLLKSVPKPPTPPPISQEIQEIDPSECRQCSELAIQSGDNNIDQAEVLKTVKSNLTSTRSATGSRNALINNIKKEMATSHENFMRQRQIHQETLKGLLDGKPLLKSVPKPPSPPLIVSDEFQENPSECYQCSELDLGIEDGGSGDEDVIETIPYEDTSPRSTSWSRNTLVLNKSDTSAPSTQPFAVSRNTLILPNKSEVVEPSTRSMTGSRNVLLSPNKSQILSSPTRSRLVLSPNQSQIVAPTTKSLTGRNAALFSPKKSDIKTPLTGAMTGSYRTTVKPSKSETIERSNAYLIPSCSIHQPSDVPESDRRRQSLKSTHTDNNNHGIGFSSQRSTATSPSDHLESDTFLSPNSTSCCSVSSDQSDEDEVDYQEDNIAYTEDIGNWKESPAIETKSKSVKLLEHPSHFVYIPEESTYAPGPTHSKRRQSSHTVYNPAESSHVPPPSYRRNEHSSQTMYNPAESMRAPTPSYNTKGHSSHCTHSSTHAVTPTYSTEGEIDLSIAENTPRNHSRPVMVMNSDRSLRLIQTKRELSNILQATTDEVMPELPEDMQEYFDKLQNTPLHEIMHSAEMGSYLRRSYNNKQSYDTKVFVGSKVFLVHRLVLACFSPYFETLFSESCRDDQTIPVPTEFRVRGVSESSFQIFIDYMYSGKLKIHFLAMPDLIRIADKFQVDSVRNNCVDFVDKLHDEELLMLLANMKNACDADFCDRIMMRISSRFMSIKDCNVFPKLDVDTLCMVLSHDALHMRTEMDGFCAAVNWLRHNDGRLVYLERVMECIRFPLMTQSELFDCFNLFSQLKSNKTCLDLVMHANWIKTSLSLAKEDPLRLPIPPQRNVLNISPSVSNYIKNTCSKIISDVEVEIADGYSHGNFNSHALTRQGNADRETFLQRPVATYLKSPTNVLWYPNESECESDSNMCRVDPKRYHSIIVLEKKVYIIGGIHCDTNSGPLLPRSDVFAYSTDDGKWNTLSSLNVARMYHALCVLDGLIYAIGGIGEENCILNSVECYDPSTDSWFFVKSITHARAGACASGLSGKLFVAGGYGSTNNDDFKYPVLNTVECYDPHSNRWTTKNRLCFSRCHASLVTEGNKLYLCGGYAPVYREIEVRMVSVCDVNVYDAEKDSWEIQTNMTTARHSAACIMKNGLIFVIGGISSRSNGPLTDIECYDVCRDTWLNTFHIPEETYWIQQAAVFQSQN